MNRFDKALMALCVALCLLFAGGMTVAKVSDWIASVTQPVAPTGPIIAS